MEPKINNLVYKVTIVSNDDTVLKQLAIYDNPTDVGLAIDDLQEKQNTGFIKSFDVESMSVIKDTFISDLLNSGYEITIGDLAKLFKIVSKED